MSEHVSMRFKAEATKKMEDKVKLLKKWKVSGVPPLLDEAGKRVMDENNKPAFDYFPDDERAFCSWTAADNCAATRERYPEILELETLSRSTLTQPHHKNSRTDVNTQIAGVEAKLLAQVSKNNLRPELESLRKERDYWKQIAIEANNDVVHQRRLAAKAQTEWRKSEIARVNNNKVLNDELDQLRAINAELTAQVAKIRPLNAKGKR